LEFASVAPAGSLRVCAAAKVPLPPYNVPSLFGEAIVVDRMNASRNFEYIRINLALNHLKTMTRLMNPRCIYDTPKTKIEKAAILTVITAPIYILKQ
jgi:hypothetical protein